MRVSENLNIDKETRQKIESLFEDTLGTDTAFDGLPGNIKTTTDTLEILIWGVRLMKSEGVLHEDHLKALVAYWHSEFLGRQTKASDLLDIVQRELDPRYKH